MAGKQYVHAAPNFSAGKDRAVVEAVVEQVRNVPGVRLIDFYADADFDRTPIELIGEPEPLLRALMAMAGKAYELILEISAVIALHVGASLLATLAGVALVGWLATSTGGTA